MTGTLLAKHKARSTEHEARLYPAPRGAHTPKGWVNHRPRDGRGPLLGTKRDLGLLLSASCSVLRASCCLPPLRAPCSVPCALPRCTLPRSGSLLEPRLVVDHALRKLALPHGD